MEKDKDPNAKKMPKKKGDAEHEVPKGLRKKAVEELLKGIRIPIGYMTATICCTHARP